MIATGEKAQKECAIVTKISTDCDSTWPATDGIMDFSFQPLRTKITTFLNNP
jgi:hypothetical protein